MFASGFKPNMLDAITLKYQIFVSDKIKDTAIRKFLFCCCNHLTDFLLMILEYLKSELFSLKVTFLR